MRSGRYFAYQYDTGNYPYSPRNAYSQPLEYKYSKFGNPTVLFRDGESQEQKEEKIKPWMWCVGLLALVLIRR